MEKPFVVCHILTSLDGKIDGAYMGDPACASALAKYGEIRGFYGCSATLYGITTMLGSCSAGRAPDQLPDGSTTAMSIFEKPDFLPERKPIAFTMKEVERISGGGLWLRYTPHK